MSQSDKYFPFFSLFFGRKSAVDTLSIDQPSLSSGPPAPHDRASWRIYWWTARDQPWRREPEIDVERQEELRKRLAIVPSIEKGIYPFRGMKLSRADVEWLLAIHENGREPVNWDDPSQRDRIGIDLRGADLRYANLRELPLACMRGGLRWYEWRNATGEQRSMAGVHLENALLTGAHLECARLRGAYLEGAILRNAYMEHILLFQAHLEGVDFFRAHLEEANLRETYLQGANLRLVYFDHAATLDNALLSDEKHGPISLVDVHWSDINLSVVNWTTLKILGNEYVARQKQAKRSGERLGNIK